MKIDGKFAEMLRRDGFLVYKTQGVSMRPLFKQNRDLVTIKPYHGRLKKYDVPLYPKKNGSGYLLHRIIEVRENDYVIRGDNTFVKEYGITDDDIIGVLTDFKRKGKSYSVSHTGYRLYARIWNSIYPLRHLLRKCRLLGGKVKRAIKGEKKRDHS